MRWARALTFLGILLAVHSALSLVYARIVGPGHKASRSDQIFARGPEHIELLIAGDSHPRTALAPHHLGPRVVNAAVGGEHYVKTFYRLRTLVETTGKQVDTLLLPLDAGSFSGWHAENFAPEYIWGRYVDFLEVGRIRGEPWPYLVRWTKGRLFPYAGELRTLNQIRTKRFGFGEDLPSGNLAQRTELERRGLARTQAKEHFHGVDIIDPGLKWAFHGLLDWAEGQGIRVVLVAFPVSRDYGYWADFAGAREKVRAEIVAPLLAEGKHDYIDTSELFWEHDELFSDPHHVNGVGRAIYSRQLQKRLVELGVLE